MSSILEDADAVYQYTCQDMINDRSLIVVPGDAPRPVITILLPDQD